MNNFFSKCTFEFIEHFDVLENFSLNTHRRCHKHLYFDSNEMLGYEYNSRFSLWEKTMKWNWF